MRTLRPSLFGPCLFLSIGLLAATAPAQTCPGVITNYAGDAVFSTANLSRLNVFASTGTSKTVIQINLTKSHPADTAGKWTAALTVRDLALTYGGSGVAGGQNVIMGQYDTTGTKPTFTPSTLANKMNSTTSTACFGLMIEGRDGLYAAIDYSNGVFVSYRKDNTSPFPAPLQVTVAPNTTPLPTGSWLDPALGYVGNQLMMFYIDKVNSIIMRNLNTTVFNNILTQAQLQGNGVAVATLTIRPHSPTPIIDRLGEVRGLWMAGSLTTSGDSDMYFMPSLNTKDVPIRVFDSTAWMNNGGVAGGRLFFANNEAPNNSASVAEAAWLLGSNTVLGGTATITLGCRNPLSVSPVVSKVALSFNLTAGTRTPIVIPGWNGAYALAGPELIFTNMVGLNRDELAHWSQTVPKDNNLKGVRVSIQALSMPQSVSPTFTNTATLEFK
ncbi:MAG: hypothetical protein ACYTKC_14015 [Planctomycetota bacterium]|jgi:hypothetical protein